MSEERRDGLTREPLFVAMTRPQMIWGVTYPFFVANLIVATEVYLLAKSFWAVALWGLVHAIGYAACLKEPRRFDLLLTYLARAPRVRNHRLWRSNSYRP